MYNNEEVEHLPNIIKEEHESSGIYLKEVELKYSGMF